MKIICETKKVMHESTTCQKEFCCKELEEAFIDADAKDGYDRYYSNFRIVDNTVVLHTHSSYEVGTKSAVIDYCPFCGAKLDIVHVEIDNETLPKEPSIETLASESAKIPKKHWWNK